MKTILSIIILMLSAVNFLQAQEEWTVYTTSNSEISENNVIGVAIDASNNKWVSSESTILDSYDNLNWMSYNNTQITNDFGGNLIIDHNGNKWLGGTEGLHKFDGSNWINYNIVNSGLPDNLVYSIAEDLYNNIWIGTGSGGLAKFDGTNWEIFNTSNSEIPDGKIYSIVVNASGSLWIGTDDSGMAKFDGSTWTKYNTGNSPLPSNAIYVLDIDPGGNLWAGTLNGVAKFNGTIWTIYTEDNSALPENVIGSFEFSEDGTAWIGTRGGGLAKVAGDVWTIYNTGNSPLQDDRIWDITIENNQEKIWLATKGGGLAVLDLNTTGIANQVNESKRTFLWPNPVSDYAILDFPALTGQNILLRIYNQQAQLVLEKNHCLEQDRIDLSHLVDGNYVAELVTEKNRFSQKLIIQK